MPCTPLLVSFKTIQFFQQISNFKIEVFSKVRQTAFSGSWDNLTGDFQGF